MRFFSVRCEEGCMLEEGGRECLATLMHSLRPHNYLFFIWGFKFILSLPAAKLKSQPLPLTIAEYKNHPLYVLKRHLLKFEG
jgi:hypothetical protein